MNLIKALPVVALIAALGVGVTFAHSESTTGVDVYKNTDIFGAFVGKSSCRLFVTKKEGGQFVAYPPSFTKAKFSTIWPNAAGDVVMPVTRGERQKDEYMTIQFEKKNDEVRPVGFTWSAPDNHEAVSCGGLELSN